MKYLLASAALLTYGLTVAPAFADNGDDRDSDAPFTMAVYGDAPYGCKSGECPAGYFPDTKDGPNPGDTRQIEATPAFIDAINAIRRWISCCTRATSTPAPPTARWPTTRRFRPVVAVQGAARLHTWRQRVVGLPEVQGRRRRQESSRRLCRLRGRPSRRQPRSGALDVLSEAGRDAGRSQEVRDLAGAGL